MIKCPQCGADNMIGAIFCRTCSGKLDLDELTPEDLKQTEEGPLSKRIGKILYRCLHVAILLGLIGILVGLCLPVAEGPVGVLDGDALKRTKSMHRKFKKYLKPAKYSFNSEEVTALANHLLGLQSLDPDNLQMEVSQPEATGLAMVPEHISIDLLSGGNARIVLRTTLGGKLSLYSTVVGSFDTSGDMVTFKPISVKHGKIGLPGALWNVVLNRFQALTSGNADINTLKKGVKQLEIDEDSVKFRLLRG